MKKLILIILLTGAFLGGYYLGRLQGSPDIFTWAQDTCKQAAETGQHVATIVKGEMDNAR